MMKMSVRIQFISALFCVALFTSEAFGQIDTFPDLDVDNSLNKNRLKKVLLAESTAYVTGLYFLNNVWYKNHQPVPFHFHNDLSGWLQIDKAGHMYGAYYESYYGIKALRWSGVSEKRAIWFGGSLGLLMQTPIEVFDGLYAGYGFSVSDMVANALGSALVVGQELRWKKQRITMKFSYHPTQYPEYRPSVFGSSAVEHFFTDYNGHTYWLSANISAFFPGIRLPRWLNLAAGYGAKGMLAEFENPNYHRENPLPVFERSRQIYLSVDLNLKAFQTKSTFLKNLLKTLNMIKIPAPAIVFNSSGGVVFHPVYF